MRYDSFVYHDAVDAEVLGLTLSNFDQFAIQIFDFLQRNFIKGFFVKSKQIGFER